MRKFFLLAALTVLSSSPLPVRAEVVDGVKAIVHDSIITYMEVQDATTPVREELIREYRNQPEVYIAKYNAALDENTERLLQNELILHEFKIAGYNLPESIIDEYVQERVKEIYGDRATLTRTLAAQGLYFEKWRLDLRNKYIVEQMRFANVSREIIVSPHKIETYYLQHTNDFKVAEQVKLRMILLVKPSGDSGGTRKLADEVLTKIKEGAPFAEMAGLYSQAAERTRGGERNWEELSGLKKELAAAAGNLTSGQVSEVVETPEACYLIKLEDKKLAHTKPLAEVRDEIERILLSEQRSRLQQQWIERLRKKTFVRYF